MLTTKDLSFVGYTYKNFDAVKEGLRQSFGMSSDYFLWPWEQFLFIFLQVSLVVFFLNVRVKKKFRSTEFGLAWNNLNETQRGARPTQQLNKVDYVNDLIIICRWFHARLCF